MHLLNNYHTIYLMNNFIITATLFIVNNTALTDFGTVDLHRITLPELNNTRISITKSNDSTEVMIN